ncbi:hypothetical protein ABZY03_33660, partial [Streptomyces klenkii]|uniref:hypothetical protein n=1 Tax=Streptomyces klenkii TaxID=1420899 RepID=UPI0033BB4556
TGVALARGITISAGCLSRLEPLLSLRILVRNAFFVVALAVVAICGTEAPAVNGRGAVTQVILVSLAMTALIAHAAVSRRRQRRRLLAEFASG